ncbi:hypothetical protein MLD38_021072 [Melastoma candidum]|uniref:Uncharacterized protein n=1 Tax=Melastoma candidum TaxID=119954 RepID=A0ACB9QGT0_9MYRT|nr:hypothetical protein MLD38_021072 [Melastoma candidum]
MALLNRQFAYAKIEAEDPEEIKHRKAQFLIWKTLEKADAISRTRRGSSLQVRLCRLKVKIGKRLKKPRKRAAAMFAAARVALVKRISHQVKYLESLIC